MRYKWSDILLIRKEINILLIGAFVIILLVNFVLIRIPELFPGGHTIGDIVTSLCLAYISSYIFYFFVVFLKEQTDRKNIYEYCAPLTRIVISDAESIIAVLKDRTGIELKEKYPSKVEVSGIMQKINPNSRPGNLMTFEGLEMTWLDYFNFYRNKTKKTIDLIYQKMSFLDSEHIRLLTKIMGSNYFFALENFYKPGIIVGNYDRMLIAPSMHQYFSDIRELENYYQADLEKYVKDPVAGGR